MEFKTIKTISVPHSSAIGEIFVMDNPSYVGIKFNKTTKPYIYRGDPNDISLLVDITQHPNLSTGRLLNRLLRDEQLELV